jgi:hypothetical protein
MKAFEILKVGLRHRHYRTIVGCMAYMGKPITCWGHILRNLCVPSDPSALYTACYSAFSQLLCFSYPFVRFNYCFKITKCTHIMQT